ncbi:MAG TPA: hypothetical protein VNC50_03590 [Planctomycetia bacterium]|nr:hypothetical protein [Planctomycetia bacterium]
MSVAPEWRLLPVHLIPKRLRAILPSARGNDDCACFSMGAGPFARSPVSDGLELLPDAPAPIVVHGVVAPRDTVSLAQYADELMATRPHWKVDEK